MAFDTQAIITEGFGTNTGIWLFLTEGFEPETLQALGYIPTAKISGIEAKEANISEVETRKAKILGIDRESPGIKEVKH